MRYLVPLKCGVMMFAALFAADPDPQQPPPKPSPPKAVMAAAAKPRADAPVTQPVPPDFELPAEVKGEVGSFIAIRPKTKGKYIVYFPLDAGLQVFPSEMLANKTQTVVSSAKAGRYRLLAYTAVGNVPSLPVVATIVVGNAPTPPNPTPGPVDPPVDPPPAPPVVDPLQAAVTAAYKTEADPALAKRWIVYYRRLATDCRAATGAATGDSLWNIFAADELNAGLTKSMLPNTRTIFQTEIGKLYPPPDYVNVPMNDTLREATAKAMERFANLLEGATR